MSEHRVLIRLTPLLIAAVHPLFFLAHNLTEMNAAYGCSIALLGMGQAILWYVLGWAVARTMRRPLQAFRVAALLALCALTFAMIPDAARQHALFASADMGLAMYAAMVVVGAAYLWRIPETVSERRLLFAFGAMLCLFNVGSIAWGVLLPVAYTPPVLAQQAVDAYRHNQPQLPNVVYIVPDRYPGDSTLREQYGFSNTEFMQQLEAAGFQVRKDSYANYTTTLPSLTSVLNMNYLPAFVHASPRVNNEHYLIAPFNHNVAFAVFNAIGYQTTFMGGAWNTLHSMDAAQHNISLYLKRDAPLGINERLYIDGTPLRYGFKAYFRWRGWPWIDGPIVGEWRKWCNNPVMQEKALYRALSEEGPHFIFWHLYLPHPPYMRSVESDICAPPPRIRSEAEEKTRFIDQLRYTNRLLLRVAEEAKKASRRPLIIVLQSDEGPYPWRILRRAPAQFADMTPDELRVKFGNLNAIYMERFPPGFSMPATPVNNFRVIFNAMLGTDFPMLEDRIFLKDSDSAPNQVHDITDRLLH